ncbi:MAG: BREX-2 system adenine-specific DNA-methyltransferase PglX, partial [Planctomycetota bacterium]|nr:BREX-2 system adenine-specific DNA-methyltransferase PglX [Planctomycetota bacterium]
MNPELLAALTALSGRIRQDLLPRLLADGPERARAEHLRLREETNSPYESWAELLARRLAALWVLKTVYVVVLEARGLLAPARVSGSEHQTAFERLAPHLGETSYLTWVHRDLAQVLPELFAPQPIEILAPSDAVSAALLGLWRETDADTGERRHQLDPRDTRFVGDLYERLDPEMSERFDLVQTPEFVEAFILERTLVPALAECDLEAIRVVDPACGSGHFLVGAFRRMACAWRAHGCGPGDAATRALAQVVGVDVNEYACALARFRLLLAALDEAELTQLTDVSALAPRVLCADSLLPHEDRADQVSLGTAESWLPDDSTRRAVFGSADVSARLATFIRQGFTVVVGNPPYSRPQDTSRRELYRNRYRSAFRKYGLTAPFVERALQLATPGGWVGLIVANDFITREWGKPLIERVLAATDLREVVDSSRASIFARSVSPIMIFARRQRPQGDTIRVTRSRHGETADTRGQVWASIAAHAGHLDHEDRWIGVVDVARTELARHPWTLTGGGVAELKARLESEHATRLEHCIASAGFLCITGDDDAFVRSHDAWRRARVRDAWLRPLVVGKTVRDWSADWNDWALLPYAQGQLAGPADLGPELAALRPWRRALLDREAFDGQSYLEAGRTWYEYHQVALDRLVPPIAIVFAFVERGSHFVLMREPFLSKQTAPVIKLPRESTEEDHLALVASLNSSVAALWFRASCKVHPGREPFLGTVEHSSTRIGGLPLPTALRERRVAIARALTNLLSISFRRRLEVLVQRGYDDAGKLRADIETLEREDEHLRRRGIALQEELDWATYAAYGLVDVNDVQMLPDKEDLLVAPGQRPFELRLTAQCASGEVETSWFDHLGVPPQDTLGAELPDDLRRVITHRRALIDEVPELAVLEAPEYKRRWEDPQ